MLKRAFLLFLVAAASGSAVVSCGTTEATEEEPASAEAGLKKYEDTCALCHGKNGEGYVADDAPAISNGQYLAAASDRFLKRSIGRGRPGTTMSGWHTTRGGPYDDRGIADIVAYMRTWPAPPAIDVDAVIVPRGEPTRGQPVYQERCASCHGATGTEGQFAQLANAEFLAAASDGFLQHAIAEGRPGTQMSAYRGQLSDEATADVIALLRSWQKPVSADTIVPPPGTLGPTVLNPTGPDPAFTPGNRFTPAELVKGELDRGARMVILDARPPSDYVAEHITGAINVPFYEAAEYLAYIPKSAWVVAYCGCPHAESGRAMDTLVANGYPRVTIIDEGFIVWRSRGYGTRTGNAP